MKMFEIFKATWQESRRRVVETRRREENMSRLLRRSLDYVFLQDLLNAAPVGMEIKIGPLADGTTLTMTRKSGESSFDSTSRTQEARFETYLEAQRRALGGL